MGEQRKFNYALQPMSREDFKRLVTADQPEAPDYFVHDAILNRQERKSLEHSMRENLKPLSLEEVLAQAKQGSQLLDVRDAIDFQGGHLRGTLNIALSGKYATWCGSMLAHDRPIIVVAEGEGDEEEAVMRLGRIGFDNVAGYLAGGMNALNHHEELLERTDRITGRALADWLAGERPESGPAPLVLDVRSAAEYRGGHIDGSRNVALPDLASALTRLPQDSPVVVHCEGGYRSAIAASLLQQHGHAEVYDLIGGFKAWLASKLPTAEAPAGQEV